MSNKNETKLYLYLYLLYICGDRDSYHAAIAIFFVANPRRHHFHVREGDKVLRLVTINSYSERSCHEFTEAVTDNRVLNSDVEALRVKVTMAEDLVTRGSLPCSFDHLLQTQIATTSLLNARNLCRASEVPSIVDLQQANKSCCIGATATGQAQSMGTAGVEAKDGNTNTRLNQSSPVQSIPSLDNPGCVSDNWPWDSHANIMSKQF